MRSRDDVPLPQATSIEVDVPPPTSWDQVEQFIAQIPPFANLSPEQVELCRELLAGFHRETAHLPKPMPPRVAEFVRDLERAAS